MELIDEIGNKLDHKTVRPKYLLSSKYLSTLPFEQWFICDVVSIEYDDVYVSIIFVSYQPNCLFK